MNSLKESYQLIALNWLLVHEIFLGLDGLRSESIWHTDGESSEPTLGEQ